jgi:serine phosphatase RsbU (regulator of sigma subunit)
VKRGRLAALALAAGLLVLLIGTSVESAVIATFRPTGIALEWVSDVVASTAVAGLTYLALRLGATRSQVADLERARITLDEQLRVAAEIQRRLLPAIPAEWLGCAWAARMIPAYEVGGDFYDFLPVSDDAVVVILGDVSGKGIPAALLQSALKMLFRVHASATSDLATVAARISRDLREETGGTPYATAILARLDRAPLRLTFVNAGHPAGFLVRDASPIALASTGLPLGVLPDARYEALSVDLYPGDVGVFVTDGVTEALEGGTISLRDALEQSVRSGLEDPARLCAHLMDVAGEGPGPPGAGDWQDDRTAFAFRVLRTR